jgi:RimJ/RimL family protein N-acetyltransferase
VEIVSTQRLRIRELDADADAAFVCELLNTPKFIKYIGDRGVRSIDESREFIETRYRQSYRDHGYGLYVVEVVKDQLPVGICGFVRRATLPGPDLGFAFLPEYEGQGYGVESAAAVLEYGERHLGFKTVYAITTLDNQASIRLLEKLGFKFESLTSSAEGEKLRLFAYEYPAEG